MPAPRPPPAIAPIIAPLPAPTRPPPSARSAGLYGSAKAVVANINPAPITLAMVDCFVIRVLPRSYGSGAGLLIRLRSRSSSTRHPTGQTNGAGLQFQSLPRPRVCPTRCRSPGGWGRRSCVKKRAERDRDTRCIGSQRPVGALKQERTRMTRHRPAGVAAVVLMSGSLRRRPFLPLRHRYLSLRQLPSPVPALQRQSPLL